MVRVLVFLFLWFSAAAQEFRATLNGRIVDPAAAPVAGARVVLKNQETGESVQVNSGAAGDYTFALVRPGRYDLEAAMNGFKTTTRRNIELNVNQMATLDLTLPLGEMTQEITVTDEAPLLESASADRGGVIDSQTIKEMPMNGRNPFMLASLVAGVNHNGSLAYMRPFDNGAIADWGINGGANRSNEFLLDGVPNNAQAGGNNIAYVPPVDSVQEFKIQTNSYDAQYGKTSGGIVNVVLKSGGNRFHGSVYEFARRNAWDSNSFQNNARGAPKDGHIQDQYGVQLDGPVILPKLYDGRSKTFFLFNFEGFREASPQPLVLNTPEMEMRTGDFSKLKDARNRAILIYDPQTTFQNPELANRWDRLPFPGNIIPADRINPISQKIISYFPKPNTVTPGSNYSVANLFLAGGENQARDSFYNWVVKIDQNLGSRHRFFFRHASNTRTETRNINGITEGPGQDGQHPHQRLNGANVIDWISTLSPNLLLNVRSSYARFIELGRGDGNAGFDMATLGFPESLVRSLPYGPFFGRYTFDGYLSLGKYPTRNVTNTFTLHPNVTYIRGPRTWKGGLDMRWTQFAQQNTGNVMVLGANRVFTQRDYQRADAFSGNSIASWLMGTPSSGSLNYNVFPYWSFPYFAPWVQHDWRVNRKLTFNFGLRFDWNLPPTERFDRLNRGFDPDLRSPLNDMIDMSLYPELKELRGSLRFAGIDGEPRRVADGHWSTYQPRIGAAFQLNSRTVIRGGWGRYYTNPNNDYLQTNGFSMTTPFITSTTENRLPVPNRINDPFPLGIYQPEGSSLGALSYVGRGFNFVNDRFRIPAVDQFSFSIQRQLSRNMRLEFAYSGSRGSGQQNTKVFNEDESGIRDQCNLMLGGSPSYCTAQLSNPFKGLEPFADTSWYTQTTLSRFQLYRPFPQFTGLTEYMRNDGRNWYNSLQIVYGYRARWINLNANYTWSKNIEENGFLDPLNDVLQRGLVAYDRPQRVVLNAVTQLPFGRGRKFLSGVRGWREKFIGGWDTSIIFQAQSGRPWPLPGNVVYLKDATLPIDWKQERIQAVQPCVQRWNENNTITWMPFSLDAGCTEPNFLITPNYNPRYTPYRDNHVRFQGMRMFDFSLTKMTVINERYRLQFRAEVFNLTNSFWLVGAQFNNNPEDVNFGSLLKSSTSAPNSNYPRQIQLAVKFLW
jgi:hypothetical protein